MSKKVLIATEKPFAAVAAEKVESIFQDAGYSVTRLEKYKSKDDLLAAVAETEVMIIRSDKIDGAVLKAAPNLKLVIRAGAGYDNVDCAAAKAQGVVVMNTPGQNANAVAELAVGFLVYTARGFYNGKPGTELLGKTLGLLGFGAIGRRLAHIALAMGMKVLSHDPYIEASVIEEAGCRAVEADELWPASDYLSLHIPAISQTIKSIGYDKLTKLPANGTLLNTARKEVVDEDGLVRAFTERDDIRYVSDIAPSCASVFAEKFAGRFYFSPKKMGAQTAEANFNAGVAAANQTIAFFDKGDTTFQVNK
jgi:D-3-phosphoglycerate dehydrogenase